MLLLGGVVTGEEVNLPPFGAELRRLRQQSRKSLRGLGHELNVDHSHLSKIEKGQRDPTVGLAVAADRVFGTTPHLAWLAKAARTTIRGVPSAAARLPPGAREFVGREQEWARLDEVAALRAGPAGVRVVVLQGAAGLGATELALQWGQSVAEQFPDGQILLDLHGFDGQQPVDPAEALEKLLFRRDAPPELIPPGVEQRSDLHRALLMEGDLKLLYVLDGAHSSSQVRPLLPQAPGCMVVVTSRVQLTGLLVATDAVGITLGPLQPSESMELLGRLIGATRIEDEPDAAAEIGALCGGHPQALRVAATYAARRPREGLQELATRLSPEKDRLVLLSPPDDVDSLRARFDRSYQAIDAGPPARLYRLLSLYPPGEQITDAAAAALDQQPVEVAREVLRELASRHLLEETASQRWVMPELLRLHAADLTRTHEPADDREHALDRLLRWYHSRMTQVAVLLTPASLLPAPESVSPSTAPGPEVFDPADRGGALAWADQEASTVAELIQQARAHGQSNWAWRLAVTAAPYFRLRRHWPLWTRSLFHGLHAARENRDMLGEAWTSHYIGWAHCDLRHFPEAVRHLRRAVELHKSLGGRAGTAWSQCTLGKVFAGMNRWEHAQNMCADAMVTFGDIGDQIGQGYARAWWSAMALQLGDLDAALGGLRQAMEIFTNTGSLEGQALVQVFLASTYRAASRPQQAIRHANHALTLRRTLSDNAGSAEALVIRGDAQRDAEQHDRAREDWTEALDLFTELSDPRAVDAQTRLATVDTHASPDGAPVTAAPAVPVPRMASEFRPRLRVSADRRYSATEDREELAISDEPHPEIRTDVPHSARIWNYWLGGKDNYVVDREAGDAALAIYPGLKMTVTESRKFLIRAVRFLAEEAGIRQFLDIGTGLPTEPNTHEAAQNVAPESKIVYVDNDPLVLAHARALLKNTTEAGVTEYIDADLNDPGVILDQARTILDFTQPIAVLLLGVLGNIQDYQDARRIVTTLMDVVPSGSYLCIREGTTDDADYVRFTQEYGKTGAVPYIPRSRDEVHGYFDGLDAVEPGFVPVTHWRPDTDTEKDKPISVYCAVARKR